EKVPALLPFAVQNAVLLTSGVLRPGLYPASPTTPVSDLVRIAGGSLSSREIEAPRTLAKAEHTADGLEPLMIPDQAMISGGQGMVDSGRIIRIGEDRVYLAGHVRFPGSRR